ncbi:hypothetical protein IFM89_012182 [Coptis chinensis]|uniref:Uncharacterized protein n=1 Tax=Coptis chinensis TaxID=261450 RepID=A0A835HDW6_9MAGN|nr:hypothetical protein IFM89_012182 [Coptis chinensis]
MSYEKTIRALLGHFEGRAMSYEKTIRALSLHFEGTAKSYEKTIRALSLHFEGTAKSYEKTIRELSMHFEGRYVVSTPYLCNTDLKYIQRSPNSHEVMTVLIARKRSFRLAQLLVPFFESITEQVIPEDFLVVHSEIVRAGEAGSDADVSEDMHCDESASGVQEGSNDMNSESDPFLAPIYESEDSTNDIEVNEQGERINVVNEPVSVPSPVNVRLLDENMPLTTTLPASRGGIKVIIIIDAYGLEFATIGYAVPLLGLLTVMEESRFIMRKRFAQAVSIVIGSTALTTAAAPLSQPKIVESSAQSSDHGIYRSSFDMRSETIEQAAPISVDEAAGSTGCHPQSPPPVMTTVESIGDCGMDELLQPDYNVTVEYQKYQRKYPQKKKTSKETNALPTRLGAMLPLVSDTVAVLWDPVNRYWYSRRK